MSPEPDFTSTGPAAWSMRMSPEPVETLAASAARCRASTSPEPDFTRSVAGRPGPAYVAGAGLDEGASPVSLEPYVAGAGLEHRLAEPALGPDVGRAELGAQPAVGGQRDAHGEVVASSRRSRRGAAWRRPGSRRRAARRRRPRRSCPSTSTTVSVVSPAREHDARRSRSRRTARSGSGVLKVLCMVVSDRRAEGVLGSRAGGRRSVGVGAGGGAGRLDPAGHALGAAGRGRTGSPGRRGTGCWRGRCRR